MVHYFELRFIDIDAGINVCYTNGVIGTGGASRPLLFWREKRFMNKKTRTCETGTALFGFLYISFLIAVLSVAFLSSVHKDHNENNTPIGLNTFKSIDKTIVNSINRAKEIKKDEKGGNNGKSADKNYSGIGRFKR